MRSLLVFLALIVLVISASGCGGLMENLRQDMDGDRAYYEPTTGGMWPEGGMLEDPAVDRSIASDRPGDSGGSWISSEQMDINSRDGYRNVVSYTGNPNVAPTVKRRYTSEDFVDRAPSEGSLWASNGQTNYFFTKNKIKGLGDLITIQIEDRLIADMALELRKSLSAKELETELERAQLRIAAGEDKIKTGNAAASRAPAAKAGAEGEEKKEDKKEVREATLNDVDLRDVIGIQTGEPMMGEVLERYPNGNYKIRATKRISYGGGQRLISLVAIAKAADVNETESIPSGQLYEYRLKVFR